MAEKTAAAQAPKGPSMMQVLHNGNPTWANRTAKGAYRCVVCKSEAHEKANTQSQTQKK